MSEPLLWTVFMLSWLIAAGRFMDFVLGARGQRRVKDRLAAWYVFVSEAPWSELPYWLADRATAFLDRVFGRHLFSLRFFVVAAALSLTINVIYAVILSRVSSRLILNDLEDYRGATAPAAELVMQDATTFGFILVGAFVSVAVAHDFISILVSRALLRRMQLRRRPWFLVAADLTVAILLWMSALSAGYFSFQEGFERAGAQAVGVQLYFSPGAETAEGTSGYRAIFGRIRAQMVFADGGVRRFTEDASYFDGWKEMIWPPEPKRHPDTWRMIRTTILFAASTILIPTLVLFTLILWAGLMILTRKYTEPTILLMVQRLEEARGGVFTTVAVFLSALVGLIGVSSRLL